MVARFDVRPSVTVIGAEITGSGYAKSDAILENLFQLAERPELFTNIFGNPTTV